MVVIDCILRSALNYLFLRQFWFSYSERASKTEDIEYYFVIVRTCSENIESAHKSLKITDFLWEKLESERRNYIKIFREYYLK